jgi:hypothetical protein
MGTEAAGVRGMIDRAIDEEIDILFVKKTMKLITHLRTAEATKSCLTLVQHWRQFPISQIFISGTEGSTVDWFKKLAVRHQTLEKGSGQLKVIRRLNSVRLQQAFYDLTPADAKVAKVSPPLRQWTDVELVERTKGLDYQAVGTHFISCKNLDIHRRPLWIRISDLPPRGELFVRQQLVLTTDKSI